MALRLLGHKKDLTYNPRTLLGLVVVKAPSAMAGNIFEKAGLYF